MMISSLMLILLMINYSYSSFLLPYSQINETNIMYKLLNHSSIIRKLIGSNCVLVVRGDIPPYYSCIGCLIDRAMGCVDDMRYNRSYTVHGDCKINSLRSYSEHKCCPKIKPSLNPDGSLTVPDLRYLGSAYPEALRCIKNSGCSTSTVYEQLLTECHSVCPMSDPRDGGDICLADFNSSYQLLHISYSITYFIAIGLGLYLMLT